MPPAFKKLNLKYQKQIVVLNSPQTFEAEIEGLGGVEVVIEPCH